MISYCGSPLRLALLLMPLLLVACGNDDRSHGLHLATTADGLELKLRRYRPTPDAEFRSATPVVLFPGITLNFQQFDVHTPFWLGSYHYRLPPDAPQWAREDPVIAADNLKYFSLAHYLYLRGYDVWMANYRRVGRAGFDSDHGNQNTNLDVWCALDVPAAIGKVIAVTGERPVIGGHSTGGLCSYLYLQGITMDADVVAAGEYLPHVTASESLALARNRQVKGFLGLDPAGIPYYATAEQTDNSATLQRLGGGRLVDLDAILPWVMSVLHPVVVSGSLDATFKIITRLADAERSWLPAWSEVFAGLDFWRTANMNGYVEDFHARFVISSFYLGVSAQYTDWAVHGVMREHWRNGEENRDRPQPSAPAVDDGYFYYGDNQARMTVPAFSVFSESSALVDTSTMVGILYGGKTHHPQDQWLEIPGTGHIDVVNGNQAPVISFPAIGDWLDALE
ncbi:MAG: hypothetical protein CML06_07705 [Pseudomonadales bacterium]|nr:hypothetical protein [Pseudomonadales bacterium]